MARNWWLQNRNDGRFSSERQERLNRYRDPNSFFWMACAQANKDYALDALGGEEFCRRLDILWPDDNDRTWQETARINREIMEGEQWHRE